MALGAQMSNKGAQRLFLFTPEIRSRTRKPARLNACVPCDFPLRRRIAFSDCASVLAIEPQSNLHTKDLAIVVIGDGLNDQKRYHD